jgi:ADP-ribosylglycohydrolase
MDQFAGCLIGQCVGDAVGFPVEGAPPAACRSYVAQVLRGSEAAFLGRGPFPFGQYTDDSQLARELVQSYVQSGGFDPEDYAHRIAALFRDDRIVGRGHATHQAAVRLIAGTPWDRSGTPAPAAGNGSAMRAGPIGLIYWDQPDALVAAACDQGRITHQDPRCNAGAVAIAGAVALALAAASPLPKDFLAHLCDWVRPVEGGFADELSRLPDWIDLPIDEAASVIARAGLGDNQEPDWPGISPFVVSSVLWSLYAFLKTPADYWETICTAVVVGGDVDTTAAMAGAVSGAYNGLGAVPIRAARHLRDQGSWGYSELKELAEKCYTKKMWRTD